VAEHLKVFGIILDEAKNALPGSAGERDLHRFVPRGLRGVN
jgi:hypothetical protein